MTAKGEKAFQQAIDLQGPWVKALSEGISKKRLKEAKEVLTIIGSRLSNDGS